MKHVLLDLYSIDAARLADRSLLTQVLAEYPSMIGMEAADQPVLKDIQTSSSLDDGMSGFTIIFSSHCSLHAWPSYGMVNLDVFSCNEFSTDEAVAYAKRMFVTNDVEVHEIERATRSPRDSKQPLVPHVDATRPVLAGRFAPRPAPLT